MTNPHLQTRGSTAEDGPSSFEANDQRWAEGPSPPPGQRVGSGLDHPVKSVEHITLRNEFHPSSKSGHDQNHPKPIKLLETETDDI